MNVLSKTFLLASLAISSVALAADTVGSAGVLTSLEVNTESADVYLEYRGRIIVTTVAGKNNTHTEYRWGGVSCGTRNLSEAHIAILQRALETAAPIVPRWQQGQGDAKCLVGFRLAP